MVKHVGKINGLSNETIYRSLGIGEFYNQYPRITKLDVINVISVLKHKLSYNNTTGITKVGNWEISRYSRMVDIQKYNSYDDLIRWEFSGLILNAVQRVHNGFSMI